MLCRSVSLTKRVIKQSALNEQSRDSPGWLAGLPMAVKDYNDVAAQLTTYGSPVFAEYRAPSR